MGLIEAYALFAISVGIWAVVDLIPEVRSRLFEQNRLDDPMYDSPLIAAIALFIFSTILAPMTVVMILSTEPRNRAINALVAPVGKK